MMRRLFVRLGSALVVLWAVATLTFVIADLLPSDPARMIAGPQARAADVARIRAQWGLDRPLSTRYLLYIRRLVHLRTPDGTPGHETCVALGPLHTDLGRSFTQRRPVAVVLAERAPRSLFLAAGAVSVQLIIGLSIGIAAAVRRRSKFDRGALAITIIGASAPTYVTGLLLQYLLAHRLRLLPLDGYGHTDAEHFVSAILPSLALGLFGASYYARLVRDDLTDALSQDFVRTARAKGASHAATVVRHALRTTLLPLVTVIGVDFGALVGGAIGVETLFRWPGIGSLGVSALLDRDGPLIVGTTLLTSSCIVLATLCVDVASLALDPRLRKQ